MLLPGNTQRVEIIAHRGASYDAPENTLPAISLAWERNVDAVEIDIRLTADNAIVALHDPDLKRLAGIDRPLAECTLAETQTMDLGTWKGTEWAGTRIATLDQILPLIPDGKRMFIEIKCGPEIIPPLADHIRAAGVAAEKIAFICFHPEPLLAAKVRMPEHQVYLLASLPGNDAGATEDEALLTLAGKVKNAGFDGIDIYAEQVSCEPVRQVMQSGLQVYAWTVNDPDRAQALIDMGIQGITTDRPAWLRQKLA